MTLPVSGRLTQSQTLQSNVSYEILARQNQRLNVPMQIGSGKFAKVYKAWQRSARRKCAAGGDQGAARPRRPRRRASVQARDRSAEN